MGHGNQHGHGHGKVELPDYRQWKIEGTPLEKVQERLAKRGLRDPWARVMPCITLISLHVLQYTVALCDVWMIRIRHNDQYLIHQNINEAWRYMGGFAKPVTLAEVLTKGFKWGFAAFVVALGIEYTLFPPKKNGGHH